MASSLSATRGISCGHNYCTAKDCECNLAAIVIAWGRGRSPSTRWLTPVEQRAWQAFVAVSTVVTAELEAELQAAHGISVGEYGVLAVLSGAPDQRLRMTDLARLLHLSPSGLTRRLDLLVREGLGVPGDLRVRPARRVRRAHARWREPAWSPRRRTTWPECGAI